jgi:hypothetical protein
MIYRARDLETGALVAFKLLDFDDDRARLRFAREVSLLMTLEHPRIVRYVAHGVAYDDRPFLVMELLDGETLEQRLRRGPCSVEDAVAILRFACDAVSVAHLRGVVHRDLKPSNLFLVDKEIAGLTVLDFGIARSLSDGQALTQAGMVIGTPAYMAPEQISSSRLIDARADVFALGSILFECLTGEPPFVDRDLVGLLTKILQHQPNRVAALRDDIPSELDKLVSSMLSKDPAGRPRDAAAVGAALAALAFHHSGRSARVRPALTRRGRRLVSVVLATGDSGPPSTTVDDAAETISTGGQDDLDKPVRLDAAVRQATAPFGAHVQTLSGASTLAIFCGHGSAVDQVAQAARCAVAIRRAVGGTSIVLATGRCTLEAGLPTGELLDRVANVAQAPRMTRMGRLDPAPIFVDALSARLLGRAFEIRQGGGAFILGADRISLSSFDSSSREPDSFVGRGIELAALMKTFNDAMSGRARAVVITAPMGAGKTRLVDELLYRVEMSTPALHIWRLRASAARAGSPFAVMAEVIRCAAAITGDESPFDRRFKLLARISRCVPAADVNRVATLLGDVAGVSFGDTENPLVREARADPRRFREEARRAIEDWLRAEVALRRVVLVLDDAHWADGPSLDAIAGVARASDRQTLLAIAIGRPRLHQLFPRLWADCDAHAIGLGPLAAGGIADLVRTRLGDAANAQAIAWVTKHARGSPFAAEELIHSLREERRPILPDSLIATAEARLEMLEPEMFRAVRAASVFGMRFTAGGLRALTGPLDGSRLARILDVLQACDMIEGPPKSSSERNEYVFRDELVREAAYRALTDDDRALGRRLAVEWMEATQSAAVHAGP